MAVNDHIAVVAAHSFLELQKSYSTNLINETFSTKPFPAALYLLSLSMNSREDANRCSSYVELVVPNYSFNEFRQHFRLTRGTFEAILCYMGGLDAHKLTFRAGRPKISLEKKLLITLWYLGNQESIRGIADRFDVPNSSVYRVTREICSSIVQNLMCKFVQWPTLSNENLQLVRSGFESGLPLCGCIGCIDSTHIPIKAPREQENAYVNRKGYHSIVLQGICNHQRKFTDVFCGCAGSTHDATVLRSSPLYAEVCRNKQTYLPDETYLIGDQAYPLESWLIKKYQDTGKLSDQQARFNKLLSSKRQLIEQTFGILKGRFRKLKFMDVEIIADIPVLVCASCRLHNTCSEHEDDLEFFLEVDDGDVGRQHAIQSNSMSGIDARDNIMRLINN